MKIRTPVLLIITLGVLGIVTALVIVIETGKDVSGFVANAGILLTSVAGFIVLMRNQRSQSTEISTVKRNTNGTLTALMAEIARKEAIIESKQLKLDKAVSMLASDKYDDVMEQTLTRAEINKLK